MSELILGSVPYSAKNPYLAAMGSPITLAVMLAAWGAIMWCCFVVGYLRLRHAWSTAFLLAVLAGLLAGLVWMLPFAFGYSWL